MMPTSHDVEDADDALLAEEITGDLPPNHPQLEAEPSAQKRPNACSYPYFRQLQRR